MGSSSNKRLFLAVRESGKSRIKVLADLASDEGLLLGVQMAGFSFCPHMAEKRSKLLSIFSGKDTNPILGAYPLMHGSSLILEDSVPLFVVFPKAERAFPFSLYVSRSGRIWEACMTSSCLPPTALGAPLLAS